MKKKIISFLLMLGVATTYGQRAVESVGITESNTIVPSNFRDVLFGVGKKPIVSDDTNGIEFRLNGEQYIASITTNGMDTVLPLTLNYGAGNTGYLQFSGIDAATGAAISRTNLGLGWSALTNTNAAGFMNDLFGSSGTPILVDSSNDIQPVFSNRAIRIPMIRSDYVEANWFFVGDDTNGIQFESHASRNATLTNLGFRWWDGNNNTNREGTVSAALWDSVDSNVGAWIEDGSLRFTSTNAWADLRYNIGFRWNVLTNTNAAGFLSDLFASNSLPSGAAPTNAVLQADGNGGSAWAAEPRFSTMYVNDVFPTGSAVFTRGRLNVSATNSRSWYKFKIGDTFYDATGTNTASGITFQKGDSSDAVLGVLGGDGPGALAMKPTNNVTTISNASFRVYSIQNGTNYVRLAVNVGTNRIVEIRPETTYLYPGELHISGLPTNDSGLPSGVLWNDGGTVKVVP